MSRNPHTFGVGSAINLAGHSLESDALKIIIEFFLSLRIPLIKASFPVK
jgi:hypothetical protein